MGANRGKVSGQAVRSMEGFDRVAVKVNFGAVWYEVDDKSVADHTREWASSEVQRRRGGYDGLSGGRGHPRGSR